MLRIPGDDEDEEEEEDEEGGAKYFCPETGAHFEFDDMCGRLTRLDQVKQQLDMALEEQEMFYREQARGSTQLETRIVASKEEEESVS